MDTGGFIQPCVLLVFSIFLSVVSGGPIDCTIGGDVYLGTVEENYEGDVEVVTGIPAGTTVSLESYLYPAHLEFLELIFTPGETTATVRTKKPLDADVLDGSDGSLYYAIVCTNPSQPNTRQLTVNDTNDNGPVFSQDHYITTVSETTSLGAEVLRVRATDADITPENNRVTYSIEPAPEDFTVTNSGVFLLKNRLNYNVVPRYNFIVTARDNWGLNSTATVLIEVEDFDNLNPSFSHNMYKAFIQENQSGSFRTIEPEQIKAQDGDTGINMTVTYSISEVFPDQYESTFSIDSSSGVVSVLTPIDREKMTTEVISVSIKASQTDDSSKTANAVVSVTVEDVNDNAPQFDQTSYSVSLMENSPVDDVVFRVTVTDQDQGGFEGSLQILPESVPFSIDPDGTVRVKDSTALDRETTESFAFQIEARENNPPNNVRVANVIVTLLDENDNHPVFTSKEYQGKVFANQTAGMELVQVQAEDQDVGTNGEIKYSIDYGNDDNYFSIQGDTGAITLDKTIPMEENRTLEFILIIKATDGGVISRSSSVEVKIYAPGDSKPQFLNKVYYGTIEEEQDPGAVILRVDYFAIGDSIISLQVETETDKFNISSSGELTSKVKLDYDEAPHSYSVRISISDGVNSDTAVVEVQVTDINDNSPAFSSHNVTASVPEDAELEFNVTVVPATDKDSGFNKEIRYWLRGGEGKFNVDRESGTVSVAGTLDRETMAQYNLEVVAEDQGQPARSATASLLVQVLDINDNVPKFSQAEYLVEVSETGPVGTSLLTLSAVDPDDGVNGAVTYGIVVQSPSLVPAVFELDSSNGTLQLVQPLDYSKVKEYHLLVQASDGGTPSLAVNSSVVVKVQDVNNNLPEFSRESYNVSVSENLPSGSSILTLEVTDRDEGGFINGYFLYTSDTFDINKQGVVSLMKNVTLDRETKDHFILQVVAVDQATDGLSSTAQLTITVLDYNDNAPQFPEIPDPLQISEGDYTEAAPGEVFSIVPTDTDVGLNGEVTVSLASPHPLFRFREDGMLLAVGSLDRESRETYELIIKASDKGSPQRESFTTVRVNLTDVNDNRPEFSSSSYVSSILLKDAVEGKLLLTLSATDRDVGSNALITYSFLAGPSTYLALNSETGAVTLTSDLVNITEDTTVELTATAEDHGWPPLNSTVSVTVNLRVSNMVEDLVFIFSSYNFILLENQPAGAAVGRVFATSGSDLYNVTYSLKNHTDLFNISTDGAIQTRVTLDKEEQEQYVLDVEAVDTRTPPTSAVAKVTVQVEDVNESPYFPIKEYNGSVFSIAPYRTPIVQVQASDPDVCGSSQLVYNMSAGRPYFNVEPSTGLVYWASGAGLTGSTLNLEVQATDPGGLRATVKVEVEVRTSTSGDRVTLQLSLPPDTVEENGEMLETALGEVLGYTVKIIELSGTDGEDGSLVSFIVTDDDGNAVSSDEVTKKINTQADAVGKALAEVFGEPVGFAVDPVDSPQRSDQTIIIVVGVLLALSMLGLTLTSVFIIRNKRKEKQHKDEDTSIWDFPAFERRDNDQNRNKKTGKTYKDEDTNSHDFPITFKRSGSYQNRNKEKKHKDEDTNSWDFPITFKRSGSYQNRNEKTEKTYKDEDTNSWDFPITFKRSGSYQNRFKKKKKQNKETDSEQFDLPSVKF